MKNNPVQSRMASCKQALEESQYAQSIAHEVGGRIAKKMSPEKAGRARFQKLLKETQDANKRGLNAHLIREALASIWIPDSLDEEDMFNRMAGAIALLMDIKPANKIEGMLATQMVATHTAALECLRRAMLPNQSSEGRDLNLKHGAKLLSIYTGQMDALNKSRGKGQQKVTVEHVHVEAGAQAVVGNVHARSDLATPVKKTTNAVTHAPGEVIDLSVTRRSTVAQARRQDDLKSAKK